MADTSGFYAQVDRWLEKVLELNPVLATEVGDHRWDDRLADRSLEALENENLGTRESLAAFECMEKAGFDVDTEIDHTLIVQILKSLVRRYEKVGPHRRDPGYYIDEVTSGVFLLVMKEFAPVKDRLKAALQRSRETPRVLEQGVTNIIPGEVPLVWAEVALEQARQAASLFTDLLPGLAAAAAPDLQEDLRAAGEDVAGSFEKYSRFLETEVLPKARGDFAVGREVFDELLRENHMVDYDSEGLLDTGWRLIRETEEAMAELARDIDSTRSAGEILDAAKADHPTAEGLLPAYEQAMQAARQFVIDHDIAGIPDDETLRIIETPGHLRPILPYAAYMPPGIFEARQDGFFLVTPVDPGGSAEAREEKLRGHNFAKLPITALHEAYPGHHLQLVWANRSKSVPRRLGIMLSTLFIEGWAFYCEELMEELGYIGSPIQRLARLKDQLWRAARIVIDVGLHTRGMSVKEAVDLLVERCRLEPANALAEVRRYTAHPTQPQTYLMGKLAILDMVKEYGRRKPGLPLRKMHDTILGCGSLPPSLMRRVLL
jgi:uncharacterized protein (DUF885 family)